MKTAFKIFTAFWVLFWACRAVTALADSRFILAVFAALMLFIQIKWYGFSVRRSS